MTVIGSNDALGWFRRQAPGLILRPGFTDTNVNDFRAVVIPPLPAGPGGPRRG